MLPAFRYGFVILKSFRSDAMRGRPYGISDLRLLALIVL